MYYFSVDQLIDLLSVAALIKQHNGCLTTFFLSAASGVFVHQKCFGFYLFFY